MGRNRNDQLNLYKSKRLLLILSLVSALVALNANSSTCSTESYTVSGDYPGGAFDSCIATADSLSIFIRPEDDPPINPSPWYGFKIERTRFDSAFTLSITLNYPTDQKHRYLPKISLDGDTWEPVLDDSVVVDADGTARFRLTVNSDLVFVSAQENLNLDWYIGWLSQLEEDWHGTTVETIGHSIGLHPIQVLETNPSAANLVLLIGRAHPPEVPGSLAMRAFVDTLAQLRQEECVKGLTPKCKLFQRYNFMILPLLNPDGVALGHWRHNLGSTDLNRDWGPFTQPETTTVRDKLESIGAAPKLRLMLDFHSTNRDVLYVQEEADETDPPQFAEIWMRMVAQRLHANQDTPGAAGYELAPRPTTSIGTSKNYFYSTYGIPAITFETGDNVDRDSLAGRMDAFARALIDLLFVSDLERKRDGQTENTTCDYTFARNLPCDDFYCFLIEANKATLLSLTIDGLIEPSEASIYSQALLDALAEADQEESLRFSDYLKLENRLIEIAGVNVTDIHLGRSRQDLHGTVRRMLARDSYLDIFGQIQSAQDSLLAVSEKYLETVVPAYTHGVPSQPTTLGHQLLAYSASLDRLSSRMREGFRRLNRSPYGAGPGTTSSFTIDRKRLARLLGFDSPVENSYDANFIDSMEYKVEFAGFLSSAALTINQFVENVHSQQRDPWPWLYLGESSVSGSSSMPQKRNPRDLDRLRTTANEVLSNAYRLQLNSHNVDAGMHDYRMAANVTNLANSASTMFRRFGNLIDDLVVDSKRAQAEIQRSFATSTQIAELLAKTVDVSFREAHGFAAKLVELGRATERDLHSIDEEEISEIYQSQFGTELPISMLEIKDALDSVKMVEARKGLGGPQVAETKRMLQNGRSNLHDHQNWYQKRLTAIISTDIALQDAFHRLCSLGN